MFVWLSTDSSFTLMVLTLKDSLNSSLYFLKVNLCFVFSHCVKFTVSETNEQKVTYFSIFSVWHYFRVLNNIISIIIICKISETHQCLSWYKVITLALQPTTNNTLNEKFIEWLLDDDSVNLTGSVCTNSCDCGGGGEWHWLVT